MNTAPVLILLLSMIAIVDTDNLGNGAAEKRRRAPTIKMVQDALFLAQRKNEPPR